MEIDKPWITPEERKDIVDRAEELEKWLDEVIEN
jgi:hypothetical protein